ncbi:MAG: hypothetical protein Q4D21_08325 [Phascolarctobacterium sp.]|nr:hypothetical protein [Phascolarctobacterium sp.]
MKIEVVRKFVESKEPNNGDVYEFVTNYGEYEVYRIITEIEQNLKEGEVVDLGYPLYVLVDKNDVCHYADIDTILDILLQLSKEKKKKKGKK